MPIINIPCYDYTSAVVPINIIEVILLTSRYKLSSQLLLCEFLDESLFLEPLLLLIHLLLDNFLPKREIQITITILTCGFICSSVCAVCYCCAMRMHSVYETI